MYTERRSDSEAMAVGTNASGWDEGVHPQLPLDRTGQEQRRGDGRPAALHRGGGLLCVGIHLI